MTTISLRLPDYLHASIRSLAKDEGVSINQLITLAIAEKLSALQTEDIIKKRGKRASKNDFLSILEKVPDIPPQLGDKIEKGV